MITRMKRLAAFFLVLFAWACTQPPREAASSPEAPAPAGAIAQTAHPLATRAALDMLARGGNAIDAIVAAQAMLGLVEPQMSGIGGGTLIVYWDAHARQLTSFDGLSSAPARTTASLETAVDGRTLRPLTVRHGGRSIAVPGTLPVLQMVHRRYGKLPWKDLFAPAIDVAESGFALPDYMHRIVGIAKVTRAKYPTLAMFLDADGNALPIGKVLRNPQYAATLQRVAQEGAEGLLAKGGAARIVDAAQGGAVPSLLTAEDLRGYRAVEREPVCGPFLEYRICTAGPPAYGGIYLLQVLQMMQARSGGHYDFDDPQFVHLFIESSKLARADRAAYVGDPEFVSVPTQGLVSPAYLRQRADSIDARAARAATAGTPPGVKAPASADRGSMMGGTSQLTVADADGNVVVMTTTINLDFGSGIMVDGFILNDALVNFSEETDGTGANSMAPRKRPYTAMAPAIVFDAQGRPVAAGGSAGGGRIPDYVAQGWIDILANRHTPAHAVSMGHVTTADAGKIVLEKGTEAARLAEELRARGHPIEIAPLLSGAGYIEREGGGWIGAADPRRGGNAAGF